VELRSLQIHGVTVVGLKGDLDAAAAKQVKERLTDLILADYVANGRARIVVDLGEVPYVDSSGLAALITAMKQTRTTGGDLKLCGLQDEVRAILEMTGLITQLEVHADREAAVLSWQ
jgi:anti-sigma B factor antagonist